MVNGYEFFQYDRATKLHFTSEKYNLFSCKGKTKGTKFSSFLNRKDYHSYNSMANRFDTPLESIQFLVANYAYKNSSPIHNVAVSDNNYTTWKKRKQSIHNVFSTDIETILLFMEKKNYQYNDLITCNDGMPELFKLYLGNSIAIESLHIINEINPFLNIWKEKMMKMWAADLLIVEKLYKFVKYDEDKVIKIYQTLS
jgi:hypothetical protein